MDLNSPTQAGDGYGIGSLDFPFSVRQGLLFYAPLTRDGSALSFAGGVKSVEALATETVDADGTVRDPYSGYIRQATANTARYERLGVRAETARTNLCLRSSDFSNAAWAKTNGVVDATSNIVPDGSANTTCELRATAGNATFIQDLGVVANAAKTFAVYLKRKTGTGTVEITLDGGVGWTAVTVGTSAWVRVSKTQTLADPDVGIRIVTSGDEVLAWGAQLEDSAPHASSYIPTVAASVERAAEDLQFDNTGAKHLAAAAGTILCAATPCADAADYSINANIAGALKLEPGGGGPVLFISEAVDRWQWQVFSEQASVAAITPASPTPTKGVTAILAGTWAVNDFRFYIDGILGGSDAAGAAPVDVQPVIVIGQNRLLAKQFCGRIAHVLIYNRVLSAAEIKSLSNEIRSALVRSY